MACNLTQHSFIPNLPKLYKIVNPEPLSIVLKYSRITHCVADSDRLEKVFGFNSRILMRP